MSDLGATADPTAANVSASSELFLAAHGDLPQHASPDACPFLGMVAQLGLDEAGLERLVHALAALAAEEQPGADAAPAIPR
ncbi:MAG: hypothetical protein IT304_06610 [Dehalococcoidia bacterium]|nr:hypothetical protein [Dehalococcoidia bacterium]